MYTQILETALRERSLPDTRMTAEEALLAVLDCRQHLGSIASSQRGADWSSDALAHQVAYDIALIDLARCVGLNCEPTSFDQPQRRRIEVERHLTSRGIRLDEHEQQHHWTSKRS